MTVCTILTAQFYDSRNCYIVSCVVPTFTFMVGITEIASLQK